MKLLLLAVLIVPVAAAGSATSLTHGGRERWWIERSPAGAKGPLPVVLVLHGGGGGPENIEAKSGMTRLAAREGFIAVYPAGTGRFKRRLLAWNSGNCCGKALEDGVDDVGFLAALIERLIRERKADPARIYMTGMSNGGMMAHRFACERADLVAAIAPVAGQLNVESCAPSRPVSVLMIHGLKDENAPYEGGSGRKSRQKRTDRSVRDSLGIWRESNGCDPKKSSFGLGTDESYSRDLYHDCREGTAAWLYTHPFGHIWPGGSLDASRAIWEFFKRHPRR